MTLVSRAHLCHPQPRHEFQSSCFHLYVPIIFPFRASKFLSWPWSFLQLTSTPFTQQQSCELLYTLSSVHSTFCPRTLTYAAPFVQNILLLGSLGAYLLTSLRSMVHFRFLKSSMHCLKSTLILSLSLPFLSHWTYPISMVVSLLKASLLRLESFLSWEQKFHLIFILWDKEQCINKDVIYF